MTWDEIKRSFTDYRRLGRVEGAYYFYRRKLWEFYEDLPEGKTIRYGTLESWREKLLGGRYVPSTIHSFLPAANAFLNYIGYRECQLTGQMKEEGKPPQPELSRAEYFHLLRTAKSMGKERVYLLMKVFATTSILVQDTVEAIQNGWIICGRNRKQQIFFVPKCLQKERFSFVRRNGTWSGPVFPTRDGRPMHRTYISGVMKPVCEAVHLTDGRENPKGL